MKRNKRIKKELGQHFLRDPRFCELMVEAGELGKEDTVIEIGPGEGVLTDFLVKTGAHVTAVELDSDLILALQNRFKSLPNFELLHQDALTLPFPKGPYKVIANIPYYITSPLLRHFLMEAFLAGYPPKTLIFMMQREVAEKILAPKGRQSMLSLEVQIFGEPSLLTMVPRTAFFPPPDVESAILCIDVLNTPRVSGDLRELFWLMGIAFSQKRKKLSNNLAAVFRAPSDMIREYLKSLDIDEDIRAERLSFEEWEKLLKALPALKNR